MGNGSLPTITLGVYLRKRGHRWLLLFRIFTSSQTLGGTDLPKFTQLSSPLLPISLSNFIFHFHFSHPVSHTHYYLSTLTSFFFRRASPWRVPPCTRIPDLPRDTLSCRTPQAAILLIVPLSFGSKNAQRFHLFPPGVARCGRIAARPARQKLELYPSPVITICTPGRRQSAQFHDVKLLKFPWQWQLGCGLAPF